MAYHAHLGVTVANLLTTIETDLTDHGWTLTDRAQDHVFHSTNSQGALSVVQITNCQANGSAATASLNNYLQFQKWLSWNTGSHSGVSGSGTSYFRIYYSAANCVDTTVVDVYVWVTSNRVIIFIQGINNYRNWMYIGGLSTTIAGTNDPICSIVLGCGPGLPGGGTTGNILSAGGDSAYWRAITLIAPAGVGMGDNYIPVGSVTSSTSMILSDSSKFLMWPLLVIELATPTFIRGDLEGMYFISNYYSCVGHLDVITVGATNYLVIVPGGEPAANQHPMGGNYMGAFAIAQV